MPSGVSATCLLKSANMSFDVVNAFNATIGQRRDFKVLKEYFEADCERVFVDGLPLKNFVPQIVADDFFPNETTPNGKSVAILLLTGIFLNN